MKKISYLLTLCVFGVLLFSFSPKNNAPAPNGRYLTQNEINLDFKLINETGYTIESVFIAPSSSKNWGEDVMEADVLKDGEFVNITFSPKATSKLWDVYVKWQGYSSEEDVYWVGFDFSKIDAITLMYDEATGKTSAKSE